MSLKESFPLTAYELTKCSRNPDVLRALANDHDCSEVEADATGGFPDSVVYHGNRAKELRAEADRIEAEI